ncbi:MAG TPA: OmpA family protein [Terriglobia bacterium]|nr:OmpA family protein [Terriglobia bacterium]
MRLGLVYKLAMCGMLIAFASGCATKKFVRNEVKVSSDDLSAKVDTRAGKIESNVAELSDQVGETTRITKDNSNQIKDQQVKLTDTSNQLQSAKNDIRAVDDKAGGAMAAADNAKSAIGETGKRVDGLSNQFANRNNYSVAMEDSVLFAFNSAQLKPEFHSVLDKLAQTAKQDPDAVIVLEGRTDSTGDADYNVKLGQQRMDSVLRYLVVQSDVPIQKIFQVSLGKEKPVADNKTKEGREQNRATVVRVLSPHTSGSVAKIAN